MNDIVRGYIGTYKCPLHGEQRGGFNWQNDQGIWNGCFFCYSDHRDKKLDPIFENVASRIYE